MIGKRGVPGKEDPGVLRHSGDEGINQRTPHRFGVDGGEMRVRHGGVVTRVAQLKIRVYENSDTSATRKTRGAWSRMVSLALRRIAERLIDIFTLRLYIISGLSANYASATAT